MKQTDQHFFFVAPAQPDNYFLLVIQFAEVNNRLRKITENPSFT